jgi:NifU-like protein involved in Fe-S cluster formation
LIGYATVQYSRIVTDYFARPVNAGTLPGNANSVVSGSAGDRALGTEVAFHMRVRDRKIAEISFQAFGCPHTIAACSLVTERLTDQPVDALVELTAESLAAALEAPVEKLGRLLLVEDALRNCLIAWDNRQG